MTKPHSFHIPVMGTAFTIDTPIKVAHYGVSSVISLVDDTLCEDMRHFYLTERNEEYIPITKFEEDHRARRITAYLNLVDKIVKENFNRVQESAFELGSEITKYFEMIADNSPLKKIYKDMLETDNESLREELQTRLRALMKPGEIQVNIMTKLDRTNFDQKRNELPSEFSDALAALRGYAESQLQSAIVFSAGINRRLYSYVEKFNDFYADAKGNIKKRIVLKVSDYRSSLIQGKFFAKKGLWVSEYRIESGLNCGGHAFASDGFLMGPILEEFKRKKDELVESILKVCNDALNKRGKTELPFAPETLITAQGGIGTFKENNFLLKYYQLDGTGWATPFLLCPEVSNVDLATLDQLSKATEKDTYLSEVSPLGVPFNNMKDTACDAEKDRRAAEGKPGSACPLGHLVSNTEFTEKPICTASRQYQKLKVDQLNEQNLPKEKFDQAYKEVTKKACLCNDLGSPVMIKHHLAKKGKGLFTAICPGPNIANFSKICSFEEMVGHIYGRLSLLTNPDRPNMFLKELNMYVDYFKKEVQKASPQPTEKQIAYLCEFRKNMLEGIEYYRSLFPKMVEETKEYREMALSELQEWKNSIDTYVKQHKNIFQDALPSLAIN